jgi:hypothetical protein
MEVKKEYFDKSIKPVLDVIVFQLVCEKPDSIVTNYLKRKLLLSIGYKRQLVIMPMV